MLATNFVNCRTQPYNVVKNLTLTNINLRGRGKRGKGEKSMKEKKEPPALFPFSLLIPTSWFRHLSHSLNNVDVLTKLNTKILFLNSVVVVVVEGKQ